ncbi:MAG: dipicolinate synthase subunit DpsA [Ruminococcaceae bacterium]|nr:dipicolinate synthase subunit DpsA [Oscillospiraceae bacterium]
MNRKILILGGDLRQLTVAKEFKNDGFDVSFYGFDNSTESIPYYIYSDLEKGILENDILIMGIPLSRDNLYLNAPFSKKNIKLSEITEYSDSKKLLFGGILNSSFKSELKAKNILSFDYGLREELSVYNVIPTVEGAISIAINETPFTLHGSNILICGFGRIGKILAKSLSSLGVNVTVSARKLEDLSWIDCYGYKKIKTKNIYDNINKFDIIFNTIPSLVIDEECLKRVKKNSVIIDLASGSGGIDFKYAKLLDIKVIRALSLPGKIAPQTAGIIIKNTISNILTELGVKIWGI